MTKVGSLARTLALALALTVGAAPAAAQQTHAAPSGGVPVTAPATAADSTAAGLAARAGDQAVHGTAPASLGQVAEQGHATPAQAVDIITPHITDAPHLEYPCYKQGVIVGACEAHLPTGWIVPIGSYRLDLSPTKHVVMLMIAGLLACIVLIGAARAHARHTHATGHPRGFAAGIEAMVLYIRDEIALRNLGPHGEKYVPFILTLFFFILFANLLGLIPYGSTATGNISVTATLAIITFVVVELAGIRAQGLGYLNTIFYWNKDLPVLLRPLMFVIMTPIEIVGKLAKPFALAIRLFANMTAGHIVVLALIGLIFLFKSLASGAPFIAASAIMVLELFVAFLQAFIFALLSSVFIGQIREAHH
ncbi:MAG TPA: F0F1 ATP synthase subunit A [Gemmatirosa sp.]|nr:F0F1 ATP synthase subunit A [Gemmatirosa sp.]